MSTDMSTYLGKVFDPQTTYVQLGHEGTAMQVPGGDAFWAMPPDEIGSAVIGWLVSEFLFSSDWPTWEMHPNGDEFVYLLSGSVELLLEEAHEVRSLRLTAPSAVVVPRGVWHTAKIHEPSRMLHVTMGNGTETRAV